MFNKLLVATLIAFISAKVVYADTAKYVLPNSDYNKETPSPACIDGVVMEVHANSLLVNGKSNIGDKSIVRVKIDNRTSIFTVYGGLVFAHEIQKGIKLRVWYLGKSCGNPDQPITAARIMIASTQPGDDWPK